MSETENPVTDRARLLEASNPVISTEVQANMEGNLVPVPAKPLPSIRLEGGFRATILETIHELGMATKKHQRLMSEMEELAKSAASFQKINLTEYVLDVDSLEFIARPSAPSPQAS